eukprot:2117354-Amphidinium_carterae.1
MRGASHANRESNILTAQVERDQPVSQERVPKLESFCASVQFQPCAPAHLWDTRCGNCGGSAVEF